jgi:uncharacterized Zn finger protein (UPF0148 family)
MARDGDPVGIPCPECGVEAVYNGNYFCPECDWGLPGEDLSEEDRAWAVQAYISYMKSRGEKPDPLYTRIDGWRY